MPLKICYGKKIINNVVVIQKIRHNDEEKLDVTIKLFTYVIQATKNRILTLVNGIIKTLCW